MTDDRGHDLEPDQAALDELMRAFADEPDDDDAEEVVEELVIVEQSPVLDEWDQHLGTSEDLDELDDVDDIDDLGDVDDPDDVGGREPGGTGPPGPRIIRIDDYGGSTQIVEPGDATPSTISSSTSPTASSTASSVEQPPTAPLDAAGERIVIAVDDELPDALYVDGSLDGEAGRTIVFIEDDDTGDALKPESERDLRRGIEPRMRERRMAVKRAQGRKRLKWVALVVLVVIVAVAGLAVLGSSLFAIRADEVSVTGNVYTDPDLLQAVIDDLVDTPVLLADTQAAERDLEAIPWVDEARVRTDFPHAVSIEIREREAISTYQGPDDRFRVLDRDGRVLDVLDGYPLAYLLLGGPDPVDLEPGEFAPRGYAAASELAKNLTSSVRLPNRVEMIEVAADGSRLVMRLNDGTEVRFGEARDLFAKLVRLETVLSSTETREPGVIDVSTSEVTL